MKRALLTITDVIGSLELMAEVEEAPAQTVSDIKLALGQLRAARTSLVKVFKALRELRPLKEEEETSIESAIN